MKLCLCGSLRFEPDFHDWNKKLTLAGHIVYSVSAFPSIQGDKTWYTEEQKVILDLVHLEKINQSDGVVILNRDDYVGESTRRELAYARVTMRRIYWLQRSDLASGGERLATRLLDDGWRHDAK